MENTTIRLVLPVICLTIVALYNCNASLIYSESSEKCVKITKCEPVMRLMRIQIVKKMIFGDVNRAQCGFEGEELKIYCDVDKIIRKPERFKQIVAAYYLENSTTTVIPMPRDSLARPTTSVPLEHLESNEKCVKITKCEPVMRLMRIQIVKKMIFGDVNRAQCGFEGEELKIYCDVDKIIRKPERFKQIVAAYYSGNSTTTPIPLPRDSFVGSTHDVSLKHLESSDKCVKMTKCEPLMRLLSVPAINKQISNDVRQARCGFEGTDYKIYCDLEKIINNPKRFDDEVAAYWRDYMTVSNPPFSERAAELKFSINNHPNLKLLDLDGCGPVPETYQSMLRARIYGGRATEINEYPWMALLAYRETDVFDGKPREKFRCGGTVITKNHILTAAHCVTALGDDLQLIGVRIGEYDLSTERDCRSDGKVCNSKHEDLTIDKIYFHVDYDPDVLQNDIAIIRLKGSIDFKRTRIRPICLPLDETEDLPKRGIVTGWGYTRLTRDADISPGSNLLLKISLPIWTFDKCQKVYLNLDVWYKQFCAGGYQSMDSCSGDSGGPLQTASNYRGRIRMVQRGIVSFGKRKCGQKDKPGVYTSVAHYILWILDRLGD